MTDSTNLSQFLQFTSEIPSAVSRISTLVTILIFSQIPLDLLATLNITNTLFDSSAHKQQTFAVVVDLEYICFGVSILSFLKRELIACINIPELFAVQACILRSRVEFIRESYTLVYLKIFGRKKIPGTANIFCSELDCKRVSRMKSAK